MDKNSRKQCDLCRRWTVDPLDGLAVLCLDCRVDLEIELEKMLSTLESHDYE